MIAGPHDMRLFHKLEKNDMVYYDGERHSQFVRLGRIEAVDCADAES